MQHDKNAARRILAGHLSNLYDGTIDLETAVRNLEALAAYGTETGDGELAAMTAELVSQLEEGLEPALVFPELGISVGLATTPEADAALELAEEVVAAVADDPPAADPLAPRTAAEDPPVDDPGTLERSPEAQADDLQVREAAGLPPREEELAAADAVAAADAAREPVAQGDGDPGTAEPAADAPADVPPVSS